MMGNKLSIDLLNTLFEYRDGVLYRKVSTTRSVKVGDKAGRVDSRGYLQTFINGARYLNHRLIFLMHYGYLPEVVDHIDGNTLNNRIYNLRAATKAQNCQNHGMYKLNTSGFTGVTFSQYNGKWIARASLNNKRYSLGNYTTKEAANSAVLDFKRKHYGKFMREGFELKELEN